MLQIVYVNSHETVAYAAAEMKKYLDKVSGTLGYAKLCPTDKLPTEAGEAQILLGLLSELNLSEEGCVDPALDDVVDIAIENGRGWIAGSNPRSILFGVYDYFKANGCLWVRPGIGGEHLEAFDPAKKTVRSRHVADVRFRGECLEGSPRYEHLRETVLWAPKVHMNMFMLEQIVPYNYMSRYYRHSGNTYLPNEDIGYDGCKALIGCLEADIRRTGLQFHALGHGYFTEPYGIHNETSYQKYEMNPRMENALALVDGKRGFFHGAPFWSQLCMGNEQVLRDQVAWLADYAESKPYIDFLHVWLGDSINNHCECELCRPHHPSDLYMQMLNMLDEELTRRGLTTRIVFIAYTDTLWPPKKERLHHPERFILCTAISGRDYGKPYSDEEYPGDIPVWERNNYRLENDFRLRRKMIEAWREVFDGPNFVYEYHFYTDHYHDPGHMELGRNYFDDLHQILPLGFGGVMSDQTQRCAFPTGFPRMLTGEVQYDLYRPYDEMLVTYFKGAYGDRWADVLDYLKGLTKRFAPKSLRKIGAIDGMSQAEEKSAEDYFIDNPAAAERIAQIRPYVDAFLPKIKAGCEASDPCHARSFLILDYHAEYCKLYADVILAGAKNDRAGMKAAYKVMQDRMSVIEPAIEFEFEMALFHQFMTHVTE